MKHLFLTTTFYLLTFSIFAQQEFTHPELLSFEEKTNFEPQQNSVLSLSAEHYKHGKKSLQWTWNKEAASIVLNHKMTWTPDPKDAPDPSTYTFVFWVYGKQAMSNATLRFDFLKAGNVCSWFDYGLNFTGWRGAWIAFERDMQGKPQNDMEQLRITVHGVSEGTLFFDLMIPSSLQDLRQHTADTQAPFINANTNSHWIINERCSHHIFDLPVNSLTTKEVAAFQQVEAKFTRFYLDNDKPFNLDVLQKQIDALEIIENSDGTLRGRPVFFVRWAETYFSMGHPRNAKLFIPTVMDLDAYNRLMLKVATTYHLTQDNTIRERATSMFILLTRYLLDQGFRHGSSLGSIHHMGYSMRDFYTAFFLMKKPLHQIGLGNEIQRSMEWFSNVAEVKKKPDFPGMDIDIFNTTLMGRLASLLMMENTPEKLTYMRSFVRWLNNGFTPSPGLTATFKVDGTVFHHCNNYPAYARDGMRGAVEAVYVLSKSDFAVSEQSHNQLKKALLTMRYYSNLQTWPISMSGRHPKGAEGLAPSQLGLLALAGSPDGKQDIDTDLSAAYLRLVENKSDNFTAIFRNKGMVAETNLDGNLVLPYASVMVQRRGKWAATVRGHSRYLWASETYESANLYGRYLSHGNLQIVGNGNPISNEASGYQQKGWDWNYWWGTTATIQPIEKLKSNVLNVDVHSGNEEMLYSDEAFAGGVNMDNMNGVYAMKLHEHDKYNGSLRARKSFFFFDNRIICLGTDIESEIADFPTVTTLFQEFIPTPTTEITIDKKQIATFPFEWKKTGNSYLVDAQQNAYFIKNANIFVRRSYQHSFDQANATPTENNFTVAAISHGNAPKAAKYEYAILVQPTESQLTAWVKTFDKPQATNYQVLQQNSKAHIVYDKATDITAYTLFETGKLSTKTVVQQVSIPCMVMTQNKGKKELKLSLADPDLRFYEGASDDIYDEHGKRVERSIYSRPWKSNESKVSNPQITLQGQWNLVTPTEHCRVVISTKEKTVLEFTCQHGLSRQVLLTK